MSILGCDSHAVGTVAECRAPVGADADQVALDHGAGGAGPWGSAITDDDAVVAVGGNDVALTGRRTADDRVVGA